jgi:zinc/manganese transport system substrate-binding protein
MKYTFIVMLMMMGLLIAAPSKAFAKLNVFACSPEWGALAKEIGGDLVSVYTATKAHQDVHHMRAKPSLLAAMRKADLVFCSGAALESGWLPILLRKAGGPDVQQNTVGWLMASDFVKKIEIMEHVDRSMGHIHPEGNPHVHLNPHNMFDIADTLAERMLLIDQDNALMYDERLKAFKKRWESFILRWEEAAKDLKDKNVVVYHKSWAYLTDWLGMNIIASLEPKPGLPPTAANSNFLDM